MFLDLMARTAVSAILVASIDFVAKSDAASRAAVGVLPKR